VALCFSRNWKNEKFRTRLFKT